MTPRKAQPIKPAHLSRFFLMQEIGCIPCIIEGEKRDQDRRGTPGQVNHLLSGYRLGHDDTVMECPWHHMGQCMPGKTHDWMRAIVGPSRAINVRDFHAWYGTDQDLLKRQNDELEKLKSATV